MKYFSEPCGKRLKNKILYYICYMFLILLTAFGDHVMVLWTMKKHETLLLFNRLPSFCQCLAKGHILLT